MWFDLSACLQSPTFEAEDELKERLYDFGVEMSAGHVYHSEVPGRFRFVFSVDQDTAEEGARRVVEFYKKNKVDG